jgi:DNA polymerase-3 subunit epsilon
LSNEDLVSMKDFAAIDFETANNFRSSVCSVGIVIVRDGVIRKEIYYLIHPSPNFYSYWCSKVHGLTQYDTDDKPDFPTIWEKIAPQIEGLPLVAHNSPFDEGCLKAVFSLYDMEYPNYTFFCTCRAARRILGKALPNHQLQTVAAYYGYDLTKHHHALADAEACAIIAKELL